MDSIPPGADLSQIPAGNPPPGIVPNLVDPESLTTVTIAVGTIVTFITFIFVIVRVLTNASGTKRLGWSDYFCVVGTLLALAYTVVVTYVSDYARHQWDTPLSWLTATYFKILFAQGFLLNFSIFFAKNAVLLLYLQLFSINKPLRWAIYGGVIFTFPLYFTQIVLLAIFCAPRPSHPWDLSVAQGCSRTITWGVVQGVLNVCLDIYMLILPVPAILHLQLSKRRKMGILAIFGTALFGLISAIMAMAFRVKLSKSEDGSWSQSQLFICVICETNVVIICSCMPAVAAFWRSHGATLFSMNSLRSHLHSTKQGSGAQQTSTQAESKYFSPSTTTSRTYAMRKASSSGESGLPLHKDSDLDPNVELGIMKSVKIDQSYLGHSSP